jgi:acetyltransferase-like isoleucine patch superfamily enzyme
LAAHVAVLPGVTIGMGAVVGAHSVVTHSLESFSINVGIPARQIAERTD